MKQYIKRVLLVLCMTVSLFSLSACSAGTETKGKELDPMIAMGVSQSAEGLLQNIVALDEAQAQELEATLLADKEYGLAGGVTSWMSVMKDTGAFVGVISSDTVLSEDDEYVSTVMAQFENRNAEFKMFMTEGDQGLMPTSIAFTPEYTFGEKMEKAAMNTLLGMGTVFMVLIHQPDYCRNEVCQYLRGKDEGKTGGSSTGGSCTGCGSGRGRRRGTG